ncbi:Glycerol uptake facilitator (Major Intrinsic Protein Family) [Rhizobiales bacterium GAS191]|jgi:glycerol uptake facilitator-like aquaporin|nr:Glycerol uptake facilitator (Major Intrinsic Protein Family) [Rhizobiales bacterium GAS113]SEE91793.1 Glycerol uptake facilitator (Major Intrinsic Protein Family) [Rhizobiales bacterium GAS191]
MKPEMLPKSETCFFERDPGMALARRATVEGVGTLFLMVAATGAGLALRHLLPDNPALGLMAGAFATAGALVGLIIAFGAVSGGHFNPLISGLQWLGGERNLDCTLAYVAAQLLGALLGALLANAMFGIGGQFTNAPPSWALSCSEIVASAGLMIVVFGCARSWRIETGPLAVGAWLSAAIMATPSTSYANPAITLAAIFADGPIALSVTTAVAYMAAQLVGALLAFLVVIIAYPRRAASDHELR